MDETKMRVIFPKDNNILYGQGFSCHRGVPSGVEFEAEEISYQYILTAPGYGVSGNYGNGALYVYKDSKLNINDFKVKSEVDVLRARIADLETERDDWRKSYLILWRHINNLPQPPEEKE